MSTFDGLMKGHFDDIMDEAEAAQAEKEDWIADKQASYEERIVKLVLSKLNVQFQLSAIMIDLKQEYGPKARLSFAWFHQLHPSFPVRLTTQSTVFSHQLSIVDLYKRFTTTKMYKSFIEARDLIEDGEQFGSWGMVFPWAGLGTCILHNSQLVISATRFSKLVNKEFVYVDLLPEFLTAVNEIWKA